MKQESIKKAKKLINDAGFPKIGMGTFGSDKCDAKTVADAVYHALKCGYRLFDCASVYGNEKEIGEVFRRAFSEGIVKREDIVVTSKVWNDMHGEGDAIKSCEKSISDLGIGYIDLYFVHWPFANYHAPGCGADARNPLSRPFFADEFMVAWRQMESLKRSGLVKNIAMSNMTVPKFEAVLPLCEIMPFAHETELHPSFQQDKLREYCIDHNILLIGYCPLGSPNRPERDKMADDVSDTSLQEVIEIASSRGIHPAEVCLKWAASEGVVPIPFSSRAVNIENNFKAVHASPLDEKELDALKKADLNCRLIKAPVFLWDGAADWRDLWDMDGYLEKWIKKENGEWQKI